MWTFVGSLGVAVLHGCLATANATQLSNFLDVSQSAEVGTRLEVLVSDGLIKPHVLELALNPLEAHCGRCPSPRVRLKYVRTVKDSSTPEDVQVSRSRVVYVRPYPRRSTFTVKGQISDNVSSSAVTV